MQDYRANLHESVKNQEKECDPSILSTEDFEYRQNVYAFNSENYVRFLTNCDTRKVQIMCKSCFKSMLNTSIPMQAQASNLRLWQKYNKLEVLSPIVLMLITKIIPFMFILAQHEGE